VYTCRALGIEAVGLGIADWGHYTSVAMIRYTIREVLATLNAMWEVHVTRPLPTFLGPFEGIA
jgi:vancomycin permeability regulator SanA